MSPKASPEKPKIRVKDFARARLSQSFNEIKPVYIETVVQEQQVLQDIEIISLSSEDETVQKKPKGKAKRRSNRMPAIPRGRKDTPLKYKYHKIDEYFTKTKKEVVLSSDDTETKVNGSANPPNHKTKEARVVLKRVQVKKRIITEESLSQSPQRERLSTEQIEKRSSNSSKTENGKLTNENVALNNNTNDVLKINLTSDSEDESNKQQAEQTESNINSNSNKNIKKKKKAKKTIARKRATPKKKTRPNQTHLIIDSVISEAKADLEKNPKKIRLVPAYKIVEGTRLAVDAFRFGDIEGVENYFLSHFHADHYIGLKKSFNHTLYLSEITARLVETFIKIDTQYLRPVSINSPFMVEDVEVTALDANHCPGAVMFLFKLTTGKCILHTGDFRANACMEEYPEFWNNDIDTVYLDTTYLSSKYDFQSQYESIQQAVNESADFISKCIAGTVKPLIVVGAYKIGKEKVWLSIAQALNLKVFVEPERKQAMQCIDDQSILDVIVECPKEATIHVLPLTKISYPLLVEYLDSYNDVFGSLLAIRPSGWEANTRPRYGSKISVVGIQYSEHSSFNELHRFIRYLRPKTVISTVPFNGKNLNRTPKIPASWLNKELKPLKHAYQTMISDYCKPQKNLRNKQKVIKEEEAITFAQEMMDSISVRDDLTVTDYMP